MSTHELKQDRSVAVNSSQFNSLLQDMPVGVLVQGPNAEVLLSNAKALELLGLSEDQLHGKTSFDPDWNVIHEDGSPFPGDTHPVPRAIATRQEVHKIVMGVHRPATGDRVWLLVDAVPQLNDDGTVRHVVCTFIDITDRKLAEEAVRVNEERFRKMFHGHSAVKLIIEPGTGKILDANEAAANFYGWTVDHIKQMHIHEINELPPDVVHARMAAAATSSDVKFEFRHRRADGSIRDVEVFSNIVDVAGEQLLYSIIHDISGRKLAEAELKESEARFRLLAENVTDAIWILDLETGRFRYISPSIFQLRGFTVEEAMSQTMEESMSPSSLKQVSEVIPARIQEFNDGHNIHHTDLVEQPCKDGSMIVIEINSQYVKNPGTGHLEVVGVSRNITERKRMEDAVRESENRLRHAEDFAQFGHWQVSLVDKVMHASDGALKIFGFKQNDIPLSDIQQCSLPEYRPMLDKALPELIEKNIPYDVEFKIKRPSDGGIADVHSKAEYDPHSKTVFGVVQDITERKRIETERENLILELQSAIEHIKTLKGIVPICSSCKKVRDDKGYWEQVEAYVSRHTDARFSHGICPSCAEELYPDSMKRIHEKKSGGR